MDLLLPSPRPLGVRNGVLEFRPKIGVLGVELFEWQKRYKQEEFPRRILNVNWKGEEEEGTCPIWSKWWKTVLRDPFGGILSRSLGYSLQIVSRPFSIILISGVSSLCQFVLVETLLEMFGSAGRRLNVADKWIQTDPEKDLPIVGILQYIHKLRKASIEDIIDVDWLCKVADSVVPIIICDLPPNFNCSRTHSFWKRLITIPCDHKNEFYQNVKPQELLKKLRTEQAGILGFMFRGVGEYMAEEAVLPVDQHVVMIYEMQRYEYHIDEFIAYQCHPLETACVSEIEVYRRYLKWTRNKQWVPFRLFIFRDKMKLRFRVQEVENVIIYCGLKLM